MNLFEPSCLFDALIGAHAYDCEGLYLNFFFFIDSLSTEEDINNIADVLILELISNQSDKFRAYCIELLSRVNSTLLNNPEKFDLIIELIEWHTYEHNQPGLVTLQLYAQNALTTIR